MPADLWPSQQQAMPALGGDTPTIAGDGATPPSVWAPPSGAGYAAPTEAELPPPASSPRERRGLRRRVIAGVSALVLVAVLAGGAFAAYTVFASSADMSAAQFLPANTVLFSSVDLVVAARNSQHLSDAESAFSQQDALKQATCLEWKSDIMPWLGRTVSVGAFERPQPPTTSGDSFAQLNPLGKLGFVFLAQSHDDGKAQAAIAKAVDCQKQHAGLVRSSSYAGFAVSSFATEQGDSVMSLAVGKGWVLVASDENALHIVADRIGGTGDRLADASQFKGAISDVPADRYGTTYVDLRGLTDLMSSSVPSFGGTTSASGPSPFVSAYPIGGGYVRWMSGGTRGQIRFKARTSTSIGDLAGDTYGLAHNVPGDALAYAGFANLGRWLQTSQRMASSEPSSSDLFEMLIGVPTTAPALQQPAALAVLNNNGSPSAALAVRAPDKAATQDLLDALTQGPGRSIKQISVAGQPASALYEDDMASLANLGISTPPASMVPMMPTAAPRLVAVLAQVENTLLVTGSVADMETMIATTKGTAPSLATTSMFEQLARQAPTGSALSVYVNLAGISQLAPALSGTASAAASQSTAILLTQVWNDQELSLTVDTVQQR